MLYFPFTYIGYFAVPILFVALATWALVRHAARRGGTTAVRSAIAVGAAGLPCGLVPAVTWVLWPASTIPNGFDTAELQQHAESVERRLLACIGGIIVLCAVVIWFSVANFLQLCLFVLWLSFGISQLALFIASGGLTGALLPPPIVGMWYFLIPFLCALPVCLVLWLVKVAFRVVLPRLRAPEETARTRR
ncbi:hypothetical protein [Corynebacterium lizhenjunii]|uniref:hypothetical protein n=1 Tax=Corynebacterium lizhenjunii TaxID=2709394 RepID=UPI0013EE256B|nr:hypothetical protein [Corynebacterium lizhenjunii]